ncbi:hypothetical protein [Roseomonas sp. KE0001]|uniref:hypothetical protein n=1 Tax=Roseomonas sp. KE0001 TaxID=2479201 RepID=UPI0018DF94A2|nr:hypothetical protein [Roseomonas sp. KE0001]MBI0434004.1 hypothetical protein [Roseomonas sp. KE0001]
MAATLGLCAPPLDSRDGLKLFEVNRKSRQLKSALKKRLKQALLKPKASAAGAPVCRFAHLANVQLPRLASKVEPPHQALQEASWPQHAVMNGGGGFRADSTRYPSAEAAADAVLRATAKGRGRGG